MSKINTTKKLVIEDFPAEVRPWLRKLLDPLNRFLEQTYFALVQGLTVNDNLKGQVTTLTVTANQTYPMKFAWNRNERPSAVWAGNMVESTGSTVSAFSTSWIYDSGTVKITFTGLDSSKEYTATIIGLV